MIASRLGLMVLTAIALALGVIVALDRPPAAVTRSSRLLPGFEPDAIARLEIVRDEGTIALARDAAGWRVEAPAPGPADASAVAELLGALELASAERWIREDLGPLRVSVTAIEHQGARWNLSVFGDGPAGTVRARGEAGAALVETWVARALDRQVGGLRRGAVVAVSPPTGIELHAGGVDLVASGIPLRAHLATGTIRLAPDRARALVDALGALRFEAFPVVPGTTGDPVILGTLRVLGGAEPVEIEDRGECQGHRGRWLGGTAGEGCVAGAAWKAVLEAGRAIVGAGEGAVDARPIGDGGVDRIELIDGAVVEARGGGWVLTVGGEEREADGDAVAALVGALRAPGRVVTSPKVGGATITVRGPDGTRTALRFVDGKLQREGEPYAIEIARDAAALVGAGWRAVADRVLLAEEPTQLRSVAAGGVTVTMGATFEEWTSAAGAVDLDAIGAIRELAAALEVDEIVAPFEPTPRAATIVLGFDPPPTVGAQPFTRTIVVERPARDGRCRALVERQPAVLDAETCAVLRQPLLAR